MDLAHQIGPHQETARRPQRQGRRQIAPVEIAPHRGIEKKRRTRVQPLQQARRASEGHGSRPTTPRMPAT